MVKKIFPQEILFNYTFQIKIKKKIGFLIMFWGKVRKNNVILPFMLDFHVNLTQTEFFLFAFFVHSVKHSELHL